MLIKDIEIKKLITNEKEYRFGRFLDIKKLIERMTISLDTTSQTYRVSARVNDNNERYIITIKIDYNGNILHNTCSCTCGRNCRHIAAILFYIQKQNITSFPYIYEYDDSHERALKLAEIEKQRKERILNRKFQESLDLIELYKDQLVRESLIPLSTKQYQLKVYVKYNKETLIIGLKIYNNDQGFVIKNIETFLNAIDHHENIKYGKTFEFIHSEDAFDENTLEIISFIREIYLKNKLLQKGIIKALIITNEHIDDFYRLMESLPSSYSDIAYKTKKYNIPLEIDEEENQYVLELKEYKEFNNIIMTNQYMYKVENDVMYRYEYNEPKKMLTFIKKMLEIQGGLYIDKEHISDFYKYILVDLLEDIELKTHIFDEYHQENMINLYGDITEDEQLCIQLEYIYDDYIAYGFDNVENKSKEADLIENYLSEYIEDIEDHIVYLKYDHDFLYQFVTESLPYLSSYCNIFVTDKLQSVSTSHPMDIRIGISMSKGLLNMNIESTDINVEEILDMLKAYKKKRKFYKLKNGKIVSLDNNEFKELNDITTSLNLKVNDIANGNLQLPAYRLFELNHIMEQDSSLLFNRSDEYNKWVNDLRESKEEYEVPAQYKDILREYQVEGYQWLRLMEHYNFGGILADDMGLGKTLQVITYLESMKGKGTHLVITPASLLLNWQSELEKFNSSLNILPLYGTKEYRNEKIKEINNYDLVITSYDYLRRDIELYDHLEFHTIILDEAQNIKNPKTRNALCVKQLKAEQRFALTGTPIENSLAELWSIFDFLMPHYLYSYSYFLEHYEKPIVSSQDEKQQLKLKQMITPFVLRRNKKEVLKELPDKIEQTLYMRFNEEEEKTYLAHLVQVNRSLQEKLKINKLGKIDILAMLTKLRQLCQDPRLLYDNIETPSSKLKGCMELIHSLKENNKKILLFSSFTSVLHLIEEQCIKEHISYYLLDGSISKEKRKQMVDAFQSDNTTLFLISLKAGGSGLNLTSAQAVIHYDPWWNMSAKNQATDRAYRIGQSETVQVFSLIMKNTIEEKIMELQKEKKNLADTFVEGNEGVITNMSIEDMKALFEM